MTVSYTHLIGKAICQGSAPVGAVLTIAATGSEMSNGSVITNDENMLKRSFDSNYCQCKFAVMNPELTYTLPAYQTASGCVDIMMHTMERYFSVDSMALTDAMSEALLRVVLKYSRIVMSSPADYEARATITVSYTHLDVYKRQASVCPRGRSGTYIR